MMCFFSPKWFWVWLYFCHRRGFSGLSILRAQVSEFFFFWCLHWILDILGFPFFHIFRFFELLLALYASVSLSTVQLLWHLSLYTSEKSSFFVLSFLWTEPVPVPASIDNSSPVAYLFLHSYFQIIIVMMMMMMMIIIIIIIIIISDILKYDLLFDHKIKIDMKGFYAFY